MFWWEHFKHTEVFLKSSNKWLGNLEKGLFGASLREAFIARANKGAEAILF